MLGVASRNVVVIMKGGKVCENTFRYANIHAPNERVLVDELERTTLAMAEFFGDYAALAER